MTQARPERDDLLTVGLEWGLIGLILWAPLPFGSVSPGSRLVLEVATLSLVVLWVVRVFAGKVEMPPRLLCWGAAGLLFLALLQSLPLPMTIAGIVAPETTKIRRSSELPTELARAEAHLLGVNETRFNSRGSASVDPGSTASALRSGGMLVGLLLVATSVASARGARRIALTLLVSAAFQGLYGILVLISGHDHIWHIPKRYGLDAATGTFVNRNHFACLLAISLACGAGLILENARRHRSVGTRHRLVEWFSPSRTRNLLLGLLLIVGLAGLLMSLSRAGIVVGLFATGWTVIVARGTQTLRTRMVIFALVTLVATLPLFQVGSDRILERFERTAEDLEYDGGRTTVWRDTLDIAAAFPVLGSGFGTFSQIYPLFRSPEVRKFYRHAHNDFLQVVAEGGAVGAGLVLLLMTPIAAAIVTGLRGFKGTLGAGFAAGLAAVLLHSLVDFPFRIPSISATTAIVAGVLLGLPWPDRD